MAGSCGNVIYSTVSQVSDAVTRSHITLRVERLEKYDLILREIHICPHLLVKTIKGSRLLHLVNSRKSL